MTSALMLIGAGVAYHARIVTKILPTILEAIRRLETTDAHIREAIVELKDNLQELRRATAAGFDRVDGKLLEHAERIARREGKDGD